MTSSLCLLVCLYYISFLHGDFKNDKKKPQNNQYSTVYLQSRFFQNWYIISYYILRKEC